MRAIAAALFCSLLSGCVGFSSDRAPRSTRLRSIDKLTDIVGVYSDKGVSHRADSWSLSYFIFSGTVFSEEPDRVRFRSSAPLTLVCEAISKEQVVASCELVQDRGFRIKEGALHLLLGKAGVYQGEGVVVGIEKSTMVLRLTESGDAMMTWRYSEAGLHLLVLPLAAVHITEAVFKRIRDIKTE